MRTTRIVVQLINLTSLIPATKTPNGFLVAEANTVLGGWDVVNATRSQAFAMLLPELEAYLRKQNPNRGSSPGPIGNVIWCRTLSTDTSNTNPTTTPNPVTGDFGKDFVLSVDDLGVAKTHNLGVSGDYIMPTALDSNNNNFLDYINLNYSGNNGFNLTLKDPDLTFAVGFKFKLNLRKMNV